MRLPSSCSKPMSEEALSHPLGCLGVKSSISSGFEKGYKIRLLPMTLKGSQMKLEMEAIGGKIKISPHDSKFYATVWVWLWLEREWKQFAPNLSCSIQAALACWKVTHGLIWTRFVRDPQKFKEINQESQYSIGIEVLTWHKGDLIQAYLSGTSNQVYTCRVQVNSFIVFCL